MLTAGPALTRCSPVRRSTVSARRAHAAVDEVATALDGWQAAARAAGIAAADIALTEGAFSAHTEYRMGRKAQSPAVRARHR